MPNQDRQPNVWSLYGVPTTIAPDADIWNNYGPDDRYGLLVKKALDSLAFPRVITINNLAFPVKAVVVNNGDRQPIWTVHRKHQSHPAKAEAKLSPFVFQYRDRPEMTDCITVEVTGSIDQPIINRVNPGPRIPALPWERVPGETMSFAERCEFWRQHSFVYGVQFLADYMPDRTVHWYTAPQWYLAE